MPKLNDLQSILLANAAQRDTGSVCPVPDSVAAAGARLTKAITALTKGGFAEERETNNDGEVYRADDDFRLGVFITPAGSRAIGVGEGTDDVALDTPADPALPPRATKASAILALLQRDYGATLPELIAATGWLPHTTRAALTGLRKKGHVIDRGKRDDVACYRIVAVAA